MEFLDIALHYGKANLGEPVVDEETEMRLPQTMEALVKNAKSRAEAEDNMLATLGMMHVMGADDEDDEDGETTHKKKKKHNIVYKMLKWLAKKLLKKLAKEAIKRTLKAVWRVMWNAVRWMVEEVVWPALRFVLQRLVVPMLEAALSVILSPEFLITAGFAIGLTGLGFLGKWIFDKLTTSSREKDKAEFAKAFSGNEVGKQINAAKTASAPIAAGAATTPTARIAAPPMPKANLQTAKMERLQDLISRGEGDYDSVNYSTRTYHAKKAGHEPLESMTIAQIQAEQDKGNYNAVGRYQLIRGTLQGAVKTMGLDTNTLFTKETQDMIFQQYLVGSKRKSMMDYITGKSSDVWAAVLAASQEWASVAAPPGIRIQSGATSDGAMSYYSGVQGNKASITAVEMAAALQQERANYTGTLPDGTTIATGVTTQPVAAPQTVNQPSTPDKPSDLAMQQTGQRTIVKNSKGVLVALQTG